MSLPKRAQAAFLLGVALLAFTGTNRWFAPIDDETEFVTLAHQPLHQTVEDYWHGHGQPEHPPLGGVLLHAWLPFGGAAFWSVRLPSVVLFLAGLLCLALAARRIAGDSAFLPVLWIGVLWPFAFHFARLADWYSLGFFLVAALTLTYLRYLDRPNWRRLIGFMTAAVLLVYSTYYGWVIVGCLAIDISLVRRKREAVTFLVMTSGVLVLAYVPLWRVFAEQVFQGSSISGWGDHSFASRFLMLAYHVYALFVSESVAPWYWYASIPVAIGIFVSIILTVLLLPPERRRFLIYFVLLLTGMAVIDIITTKRLLFISGWLLLSFGIALANTEKLVSRRMLAIVLASLAAVGWGGVIARRYYAAPHFIEPWFAVADDAANVVSAGGVVVTNSPSLLFSVNYSLRALGLVKSSAVPGWVEHPSVFSVEDVAPRNLVRRSPIMYVRGVNIGLDDRADTTERWLVAHCLARSTRQLVPDSGYALKARYFPSAGQRPYRISLQDYDCRQAVDD